MPVLIAMVGKVIIFTLLSAIVICSGEGNIHLLEEEVAAALKVCAQNDSLHPTSTKQHESRSKRNVTDRRYENEYPRKYSTKYQNQYGHPRRNTTDMTIQNVSSIANNDLFDDENQYGNENYNSTYKTHWKHLSGSNKTLSERKKRSEYLMKHDADQCLSQCVFANLHVVDSRGIPREAELWNKVQNTVTSQQTRIVLQNEIRACFQELQAESEDNGCSYSNKLEHCLMLGFSDRMKEFLTRQN